MGATDSKHSLEGPCSPKIPPQLQEDLCTEENQHQLKECKTWKLMHGLEDSEIREEDEENCLSDKERRPLWMHFAENEGEDSSPNFDIFDSDVLSEFREAREEKEIETSNDTDLEHSANSLPRSLSRCSSFTRPINESSPSQNSEDENIDGLEVPPGGGNTVVLYFTSLRVIRKTYDDCCQVRLILQGFRVFIDERDISLHGEYRTELQRLLRKRRVEVPMLFVRGELIGGADRIIRLHEEGELEKFFLGFRVQCCIRVCEGCGDLRFVVCENCHGSCRVYDGVEGIIRCWGCNENGLVRCRLCY